MIRNKRNVIKRNMFELSFKTRFVRKRRILFFWINFLSQKSSMCLKRGISVPKDNISRNFFCHPLGVCTHLVSRKRIPNKRARASRSTTINDKREQIEAHFSSILVELFKVNVS